MSSPATRTHGRGLPSRYKALLVASVLLLLPVAPAPAQAQGNAVQTRILGQVVDENSDAGIAGAFVEFIDARSRVRESSVTDSAGYFLLDGVPRGTFRLRAARLGYRSATTPHWRIEAGEALTVTVRLDPDAVLLAPLEITARALSASPVLANFYHRQQRSVGGTFITRDEIEQSNATLVTDLFAMVPGIRFRNNNQRSLVVSFDRTLPGTATTCPVQVYVDGVLASRGERDGVPLDELATPGVLEGIEIHRGLASVPPEFAGPFARCGVIALWTRRGG